MPPVFAAVGLSAAVSAGLFTDGRIETHKREKTSVPGRGGGYEQIDYQTTKFNGTRRLLNVPHPFAYAELASALADNWSHLSYTETNEPSKIRPQRHQDGTLLQMQAYQSLRNGRLVVMGGGDLTAAATRYYDLTASSRFRVSADIAACYPSIYTHGFPWAVVGKPHAKKNREKTLWFNKIDLLQSRMRREETTGIAVGPGTSAVFAEAILAKVDEHLILNGFVFERYIDDYVCFTDSFDRGECFTRCLEDKLEKFKLSLNSRKSKLQALPLPNRPAWLCDISTRLPKPGDADPRALIDLLDLAVEREAANPDGSVLKFTARAVAGVACQTDPGTAAPVAAVLASLSRHRPIVLPVLCDILSQVPGRYRLPQDAATGFTGSVGEGAVRRDVLDFARSETQRLQAECRRRRAGHR